MKPITILKHEFDEALVNLVNNCGLPAFIIKPSVANLLNALDQLEKQQLEADLKAEAAKAVDENAESEADDMPKG